MEIFNTGPIGTYINGVILALFTLSFLAGVFHWFRYKGEIKDLSSIGVKLAEQLRANKKDDVSVAVGDEQEQPLEADVDASPNVQPAITQQHLSEADIAKLKGVVSADRLIYERLAAIEQMRKFHVKVNLDNLQQLTMAKEQARLTLGLPGFMANIMMMLGILGTFWGLSMMLEEVSAKSLTSVDLDALANIAKVLGGMKTAFSTSLVGMICAICTLLLNYLMQGKQALLMKNLEKFTIEKLLPATVPVLEDASFLEQVNLQLSESFIHLDEILKTNAGTIVELNTIEQTFRDIIEDVRNITKTEASRDLDGVISKLGESNLSIARLVEHMPGITSAISNTNTKIESFTESQHELATQQQKIRYSPALVPLLSVLTILFSVYVGMMIWQFK
jgi:biopolymer transport protein ExbB/TolQ